MTVEGAISPEGHPRRRSAAVASARMTAMGEQMEIDEKEEIKSKRSLFKAKKSEDDAYDAGLDSAEEDEESDYDEKPKAKRPPRRVAAPARPGESRPDTLGILRIFIAFSGIDPWTPAAPTRLVGPRRDLSDRRALLRASARASVSEAPGGRHDGAVFARSEAGFPPAASPPRAPPFHFHLEQEGKPKTADVDTRHRGQCRSRRTSPRSATSRACSPTWSRSAGPAASSRRSAARSAWRRCAPARRCPLLALDKIAALRRAARIQAQRGARLLVRDRAVQAGVHRAQLRAAHPLPRHPRARRGQATTAYGALVDVPLLLRHPRRGHLVRGLLQPQQRAKKIDQKGESDRRPSGMMVWVEKKQPPIVILENVCGAPWDEISKGVPGEGYAATYMRVDTKRTTSRTRARASTSLPSWVEPDRRKGELVPSCASGGPRWTPTPRSLADAAGRTRTPSRGGEGREGAVSSPAALKSVEARQPACRSGPAKVKDLERPVVGDAARRSCSTDDPAAQGAADAGPARRRTTSARWSTGRAARAARARALEEALGARLRSRNWEGGACMPDYAWNDWGKAQVDRVLDLMDIDYLLWRALGRTAAQDARVEPLPERRSTTASGAAGSAPASPRPWCRS